MRMIQGKTAHRSHTPTPPAALCSPASCRHGRRTDRQLHQSSSGMFTQGAHLPLNPFLKALCKPRLQLAKESDKTLI